MSKQQDAIQRALDSLTSDDPSDWDAVDVDVDADDESRATIRELRLVARIARTHHTVSSLAEPQTVLSPPFRWGPLEVVSLAGRGTYGEVYRAYDPRLDRPVALKLLRQPERNRLELESAAIEEGQLLARVRHPNVVTVHGAERIDGRVGIWMELLEGDTLEQELAAKGPFPADELMAVGIALSGALHAAHRAGLLHRDVKAANVMRDAGGRVVLTDFGTGRELDDRSNGHELVGTPVYLAPEALAGGVTTVRSDVYSLGVLLHHLATGSFPVRAPSVEALRQVHERGARLTVAAARPDLPKALASVIDRAMAAAVDARYQDAAALGQALARVSQPRPAPSRAWWAVAAAVLLVAAGVAWKIVTPPPPPSEPRWILVSAFENASGDARLDRGLEVALEQELTQSRALSVVPPMRVADTLRLMRRPAEGSVDSALAREVCLRDGEIQLFAVGRIARVGHAYVLDVTVTDARNGKPIVHAGATVTNIDGLLASMKAVAGRIRNALGESREQVEGDMRLEKVTTGSLDALIAYSRGLAFIDDRNDAAAELLLRDATRLDPTFASAQIMLAHAVNNQNRPHEARQLAQRALVLSEGMPSRERYFITGSYHTIMWELEQSIPAYEALVREHPNDYWGVNNLALAYHDTGRYRDGVALIRRKAALRPNDWTTTLETAHALLTTAGDVGTAGHLVRRAASLPPQPHDQAATRLAWAQLFPVFEQWSNGNVAKAATLLEAFATAAPTSDTLAGAMSMMNLALGRLRAAEEAVAAMSVDSDRDELLAAIALARGDVDGARAAFRVNASLLHSDAPQLGRRNFGKVCMILWTLLESGLRGEAEAYASRGMFDGDPTRWIHGELAAARGDWTAAIRVLDAARTRLAPGNAQTLFAIQTLGNALIQQGDLAIAEEVMESIAGLRTNTYHSSGSRGYFWLRIRARQLGLERQRGHTDHARAIEHELRSLLQVADPDFALLRALD